MLLKTIKEVCRSCGVTEGALRYYDEKNIVSPVIKEETGRKRWLYDDETIGKIKVLDLLKYVGVPLCEIRKLISDEMKYGEVLNERLVSLEKERRRIELELFVVQTLIVADGENVFSKDDELDERKAKILDEVMRMLIGEEFKNEDNRYNND